VRFLAQRYANKEVRIHLSRHITNRLDQDEIILGGPAKNEEASRVLNAVPAIFGLQDFKYVDEPQPFLELTSANGDSFAREDFEPDMHLGYPQRDLTIVVLATIPNERGELRRVVMSSGFTSYGTFAGARYVFEDFASMGRRQVARLLGDHAKCPLELLLVLEVEFSGPVMKRVTPVYGCASPCPKTASRPNAAL
jgi:hypothetical protein